MPSITLAIVLSLILFATLARAQGGFPQNPTAAEIAVMPEYCQARLGPNNDFYQRWNMSMGPEKFVHLHHYCFGLNQMSRVRYTFDKQKRKYILQAAVNEFDYVIRNWPADFVLAKDAQRGKAEAQSLQRLNN